MQVDDFFSNAWIFQLFYVCGSLDIYKSTLKQCSISNFVTIIDRIFLLPKATVMLPNHQKSYH